MLSDRAPRAKQRIGYGPDPNQFGDLWLPDSSSKHPVVVFIHGGYWRARYSLDHADFLCQALAETGFAVWNIEYRRVGQQGGGWPGTFQDVVQGVQHVRSLSTTFSLDVQRVVLMGHSAGGHLALWAAGAIGSRSRRFRRSRPVAFEESDRTRPSQRPAPRGTFSSAKVRPPSCWAAIRTKCRSAMPSPRRLSCCPWACRSTDSWYGRRRRSL